MNSLFQFALSINGNDQIVYYTLLKIYEEDAKIYIILKEINEQNAGIIYFVIPNIIFPYFYDRLLTSYQKRSTISLLDLGEMHFLVKHKNQKMIYNIIECYQFQLYNEQSYSLLFHKVAIDKVKKELIEDIKDAKAKMRNNDSMMSLLPDFVKVEKDLIQKMGSKVKQDSLKFFVKQSDGTFIYNEDNGIAQRFLGYDFERSADGFYYKTLTKIPKSIIHQLIIHQSFIEPFLQHCQQFVK